MIIVDMLAFELSLHCWLYTEGVRPLKAGVPVAEQSCESLSTPFGKQYPSTPFVPVLQLRPVSHLALDTADPDTQ